MSEIKDSEREIFVCDCNSLEHTYSIWYEKDYNELYIEPSISISNNIFKRIWVSIKYIFGYKCAYGNFDSLIINVDDMPRIKRYLDKVIIEDKYRNFNRLKNIKYENKEKKLNHRTES
jgi:hypothetical protein